MIVVVRQVGYAALFAASAGAIKKLVGDSGFNSGGQPSAVSGRVRGIHCRQ